MGFGGENRSIPDTASVGGIAESSTDPQPQCEANIAAELTPAGDDSYSAKLTFYLKNWCARHNQLLFTCLCSLKASMLQRIGAHRRRQLLHQARLLPEDLVHSTWAGLLFSPVLETDCSNVLS